jgi:hypothetical protein
LAPATRNAREEVIIISSPPRKRGRANILSPAALDSRFRGNDG